MIDINDKIIKNKDTLYRATCDYCGCSRNYVKKNAASKPCRKCSKKIQRDKKSILPPTCSLCGVVDPTGKKFYIDKRKANGFTSWCRPCYIEKTKQDARKNSNRYFKNKNRYIKDRTTKDPVFRARNNIKTRINYALKKGGFTKTSNTESIVGCTFSELVSYLEKTFYMNYGRNIDYDIDHVHIDHIIPISSAKTKKDVEKFNHFSNLQYLLAEDNLKKSDKYDY